ncbi:MAG: MFS transporter, partial [Bryobacterales bacterium]|nr:MFS transporter [Bryobacterales bacterium]
MDSRRSKRKVPVAARTFRSFRYRNFRWVWFGAFTSTTGFFVAQIAESWYIYEQTNSESLLGLTAFLNGLPILLFSVLGGVLADRMDRRYLLMGSQALQMTAALGLAALFFTNRIEIWHILAAAFLAGLGQAFGGPAYQALIPSLVPRRHLQNAIALISIQFNLAGAVGRPIGGVMMDRFGPARCFLINGLSFAAVFV